jgi:hypothetical protein
MTHFKQANNVMKILTGLLLIGFCTITKCYAQVNNIIIGGGPPPCGSLTNFPQISSHFVELHETTANVTVSWSENGATFYEVINDGGGTGCGGPKGTRSCTTINIPLGRDVTFYVTSSRECTTNTGDLDSESLDSSPITIGLPPAAPTGLKSSALTATSFKAIWSASPGASGYKVDLLFGSAVVQSDLPAAGTSLVISGLTPNSEYNFRVRAVNSSGISSNSALSPITIFAPLISATDGGVIKYEQPAGVTLSTQAGHNNYAWTLNRQPISGATTNTLRATAPGAYAVTWCATYSDGTTQCLASDPFTVSGETMTINFVRKKMPQVENVKTPAQLDALGNSDVVTVSDYVDGFARPLQHVERGSSPLAKDVVITSRYDAFGRTPRQYLPFVRKTNDGSFMYMPSSNSPILNFYQQANDNIANTTAPFAETVLESSPLNRPFNEGSPGEDWQISNGHAKSFQYASNSATDNVFIWIKSQQGVLASRYYPAGTLIVTRTTDEDGNASREFKDKDGRVVLSERAIEGNIKLRTYFVFDDLGRLQFILPPKTISGLPNSPSVSITSSVLAKECYSYQYDERSRPIVKNIPGAGSTYLIYDKWDRVVLTQQANQRAARKWTFNKYDGLERIVMTGEISLAGDITAAQRAVNSFYAGVQANPLLRFEEPNGNMHGYTNRSFPFLSSQSQVYGVSYYDNYNFLSQFGTGYQFVAEPSLGLANYSPLSKSLTTGTKVLILGSQTYLKTINYYDDKHRKIQSISDNHLGGVDRTSFAIDFVGRLKHSKDVHNGKQSVTIDLEFSHDHRGRVTKVYHTINNGVKVLLADKKYNEVGQLIEENLHSTDGNTFLQSQDYVYNIRGWLSKMNPLETESNVQFPDQYGYELSYTTATGIGDFHPAFNGNITAFTEIRPGIKDAGGAIFKNAFGYQYDARNQLTKANYFQFAGPPQTPTSTFDLTGITYDPNGNIKSLNRKGITSAGTPGTIDDLTYSYNGNQLISVSESSKGDRSKGFIKK